MIKRIFAVVILGWSALAAQDLILADPELFEADTQDNRLIEQLLEERRTTPLAEKPNIRLSGDVRCRYRRRSERINGRQVTIQFGNPFPGANFSDDRFRIEGNIILAYTTECAWANMKIEYENEMGKISGTERNLQLERALFGYRLYLCGDDDWYVEIGRQKLSDKFESEIQYGSRLDGIFTRYATKLRWVDSFAIQAAAMVLDYRFDEYAWIASVHLEDILCRGYFIKYSFVDWQSHRSDDKFPIVVVDEGRVEVRRAGERRPFRISQILIGRKIKNFYCGRDLKLFAAGLVNHAAQKIEQTNFKKENLGAYIGFILGGIKQRCDWALQVELDYCEAQAILESDNNGIGRGNAARTSIFESPSAATARGDTNYWGPAVIGAYAFTDEFSARLTGVYSRSIDNDIGGRVRFWEVEIQGIYAF